MASSVEARVPFLDHRLVEFAFGLGDSDKIQRGVTKYVLRVAASSALPAAIVQDHRKIYVEAPPRQWLFGCLRSMVTDLLLGDSALIAEVMEPDQYRPLIRGFLDGDSRSGWEVELVWRMLTAELWFRRFIAGATTDQRLAKRSPSSA
jgi:asparagine synthase (glutamine-hydrolysing)